MEYWLNLNIYCSTVILYYEENIPSNSSNDSEGSAPQDIEKQHDSVNIQGKSTPDRGASSKLTINTNTIPISKNNSDPSTELMPLDHINQPHDVIQTLPIPFSSDNRCYTNDMTESLPEKQNNKQAKHAKESFPDQFMMGHTKGKVKKKRNVSADNKEDIVSLKMSTLELLDKVLGADTADVKTFKRYRRLVQEHSFDQSFRKSYEKAKAVVGFKLLGKFSQLKKESGLKTEGTTETN
ncbi:unnamed protein product [Mytilus edulis]|uniref:Uncharacterized protein n=1 Tax=Mytilus edulis TaxID=6550 RepID=A0A8S3QVJ6_MYTED|nr:unnamed protein product [Mytilus edulis]